MKYLTRQWSFVVLLHGNVICTLSVVYLKDRIKKKKPICWKVVEQDRI